MLASREQRYFIGAIIRETKCKEDGISKNKHKNRGLKLVKIILGKGREVRGYSSIDLSKD